MKPILVIQMQRMGDLILSFPLLLWLRRRFPAHPVWVAAEPRFARPLQSLSPEVRYLDHADLGSMAGEKFSLVVNLSHRPESLELAGRLITDQLVGGYRRDGVTRVAGTWQEYRLSLTHNNRHNRFHWADMNALDVVDPATMAATGWPSPRIMPPHVRQIGLFLGASESAKRPTADFWAGLVQELERHGWVPVLLGGPDETTLCRDVQALSRRPVASACGRLGLDRFVLFGQELAALITPDTGPMHLAAWSGLRVLNLSMGPVHAWETGPYQPGHVILRSGLDCVGCWQCRFDVPRCHDPFTPGRVARVLELMLHGAGERLPGLRLPGLEILGTDRENGLYSLVPISVRFKASHALGRYWHQFWRLAFGLGQEKDSLEAVGQLRRGHATLATALTVESLRFLRLLTAGRDGHIPDWQGFSPALRPLSGYVATHLENNDGSPSSRKRAVGLVEHHLALLSS
jgi:hypothetical protein